MSTPYETFLLSITSSADSDGEEVQPERLLASITKHSQPVHSLLYGDEVGRAFEVFSQEFPFIAQSIATNQIPPANQIELWKGLMRFLFRGLRNWEAGRDPQSHQLVVFLLVANFAIPKHEFWSLCPKGIEQNSELRNSVGSLFASFKADVKKAVPPHTPIWERRAFENFMQADSDENWVALAEWIPRFRDVMRPPLIYVAIVQCLQRLDAQALAALSRSVEDISSAIFMTAALGPAQCLELALNSPSSRVQFACVFEVVKSQSVKLTPAGGKLLTDILKKVSADSKHWNGWMHAFNKFPARYMALQEPLGDVLSTATLAVIQSYVDSHDLASTTDASRFAAANCLRAFHVMATLPQRLLLWEQAFRRWNAWASAAANVEGDLTDLARNVLDYAVVGFIVEGMTAAQAAEEKDKIVTGYLHTPQEWHSSVVSFNTTKYRRLTQLQPYAHAEACRGTTTDFLPVAKYQAIDPKHQPYLAALLSSE